MASLLRLGLLQSTRSLCVRNSGHIVSLSPMRGRTILPLHPSKIDRPSLFFLSRFPLASDRFYSTQAGPSDGTNGVKSKIKVEGSGNDVNTGITVRGWLPNWFGTINSGTIYKIKITLGGVGGVLLLGAGLVKLYQYCEENPDEQVCDQIFNKLGIKKK